MAPLKGRSTFHMRLQEMCDCYMETDYRQELENMVAQREGDLEEETLKYLALLILLTITEKGRKLTIKRKKGEDKVTVKAEEKIVLSTPSLEVTEKVFEIMRSITDLEGPKGKEPFSLGIRDSRMELEVTLKKKNQEESVTLAFTQS